MTSFERGLIGLCFSLAPATMGVAILLAGYSQLHGQWWQAAVQLAITGAITNMIYGVSLRAIPQHAGKNWKSPTLLALQVGASTIAAVLVTIGYGNRHIDLIRVAHMLAFLSALLYFINLRLLFQQPGPPRVRIAWDDRTMQQRVDRLAIPFTIISGMMIVVGTGLAVLLDYWTPTFGRWDLVWGHIMLLGFFYPMASGTSYHVLSDWSGVQFRSISMVRLHQASYLLGFPAMTIALGWNLDWLFLLGGPLVAVSMIAWAINIIPLIMNLRHFERSAIAFAIVFLAVGVTLGVSFAIDPALGPRLRSAHVMSNLFGFAGLLISGFGYRYVPICAQSQNVRWPQLRAPQVSLMIIGIGCGVVAMALRMYGHADPELAAWAVVPAGIGMLIFAFNAASTFVSRPGLKASPLPHSTYGQH